jgi:hypothetical protein
MARLCGEAAQAEVRAEVAAGSRVDRLCCGQVVERSIRVRMSVTTDGTAVKSMS